MPVTLRRLDDGSYSVRTPGGVKAKHTTKQKAEKLRRLLNALDHGFVPTKRK